MNSFDCKCADVASAPPDPRKHVNFVQGMVLGADDLQQDFVYNRHQRNWLAREAIGYGTLSGLHVDVPTLDPAKGIQIAVSPGTALSPRGQLIRVVPRQCATLNTWLDLEKTQAALQAQGVPLAGSAQARVYVVLCFRDCKVDPLPIPGEPCRCADQAMAPSRVLDDFRLELRLTPPAQKEEDAIRDVVEWLRQVRILPGSDGGSSVDDFLAAIRQAAEDMASPPGSPLDYLYGSPPQNLAIPSGRLCEYLRAAMRLWVTELRPRWQTRWTEQVGGGCGCHGDEHPEGDNAEECLLLAELDITMLDGQVASAADLLVNEERRPFVVHLRMLQELLLCGPCCGDGCNPRTFASVFAVDRQTLRLWIHHPAAVTIAPGAISLRIDDQPVSGFTLTPVVPGGSPPGNALNLFDIDLGASPPAALSDHQTITVTIDLNLVAETSNPAGSLAALVRDGDWCYPDLVGDSVNVFGTVVLPDTGLTLAGDANGPMQTNVVTGIQNNPVDMTLPGAAQPPVGGPVLGFDSQNSKWFLTPTPQPAQTDPTAVSSDTAANRGASVLQFALADHVHPLGRVQLGNPKIPDPAGSDVLGTVVKNLVVGIQGIDVQTPPANLQPGTSLVVAVNNNVPQLTWGNVSSGSAVVAAGQFDITNATTAGDPAAVIFVTNNLTAICVAPHTYLLQFKGFNPEHHYVVKGTPVAPFKPAGFTFEVVDLRDANLRKLLQSLVKAKKIKSAAGLTVRTVNIDRETSPLGFMVEISDYT